MYLHVEQRDNREDVLHSARLGCCSYFGSAHFAWRRRSIALASFLPSNPQCTSHLPMGAIINSQLSLGMHSETANDGRTLGVAAQPEYNRLISPRCLETRDE